MKGFRKLALTAAIAALPAAGMAMQPMGDEELGDVSGQDGIRITMDMNQNLDMLIVDTDGLDPGTGPAGFTQNGGIYIQDMGLGTGQTATIDIDAGSNGSDGVLVVQVNLAPGFQVVTGDIHAVDASGVTNATTAAAAAPGAGATPVLNSMTITFGSGLDLELQLGDGADNFLEFTNANLGTLTIGNFALVDNSTGQSISVSGDITVTGADLTGTAASITSTGLALQMGAGMNGIDVSMAGLQIGAGTIGDVYILGLNMAGNTITIGGK
jgi:hypothetical protein